MGSESRFLANQRVYCRDHPYFYSDHPHTLTVPDGWACCRPVFVWEMRKFQHSWQGGIIVGMLWGGHHAAWVLRDQWKAFWGLHHLFCWR